MNSHVTERNTQIIAAYTAGNRNKSELARYFGVSATTVRRVLAGVVMISSGTVALSPTIALAELKGDELAAAQAYIAAQPDMPQYLKNTILNGTDLTAVNYQLKNNEYVIQATQEHIKTPPISLEEYRQHQSEKQAAELTAYQHNDQTGNPTHQIAEATHPDAPSDAALSDARVAAREADQLATFTAMKNAEAQENQRQAHADRMPALNNAEPTHLDAPSDADLLAARHDARVADQVATFNAMKTAEAQTNERQAHAGRMPALNNAEPTHLDAPAHIEPETVTSTTNIGNQKAESQSQLTSKKYASANGKSVTQITSTPAQQPVVKQEVRSTYYDKQITALNAAAEQDHAEVLAESHSRAVGDANTLSQANDYTNKKFSDLKSEVDDNKDQANAGTASALAAVGIPQVEAGSDFMVGAGAGTYGNQSAIAVGVSGHITAKTVTKLAVTGDTNNGVGASAGIGWNF